MRRFSLPFILTASLALGACSQIESYRLTTKLDIEPPAKVTEILMAREYDEFDKLNLSLSVQGVDGKTKSVALNPKLYSAKKVSCKPAVYGGAKRVYECSMSLMITLRDRDKPSPKGERLIIHQKDNGEWALGHSPRESTSKDKPKDKPKNKAGKSDKTD